MKKENYTITINKKYLKKMMRGGFALVTFGCSEMFLQTWEIIIDMIKTRKEERKNVQ